VLGLVATADRTADRGSPRWHSVLIVTSFVLVLFALGNLADVLGAEESISFSGTVVWVGVLLIALMAWFSTRFDSGIATLIGAVTLVAVVVAFVDWVFWPARRATTVPR